ncbi:hypothetical protein CCHR01_05224 [Colletotrichum chrysophilum]|uniref:Uncharacterized protein n=1 Tax=Colletotrichum chrysophilum TaxID=1836956 RepID=A0AAD9ARG0_9PEZI|nr:hypothetical protein CCHR01_05224 [Colletotrichum chrysophilum]
MPPTRWNPTLLPMSDAAQRAFSAIYISSLTPEAGHIALKSPDVSSDGGAWRSGSRLKQASAIFTCTDTDSEDELRVVRRWLIRRGLDTWVTDDPSTVVAVALLETEPIDLSRLPCLPRDTTSASAVLTRQIAQLYGSGDISCSGTARQ